MRMNTVTSSETVPPADYMYDNAPPADYDNQVGNPNDLRISSDTNASNSERAIQVALNRNKTRMNVVTSSETFPPADYMYDNVPPADYDNQVRNPNDLRISSDTNASSGGASVSPVPDLETQMGCQHLRNSNDSAQTSSSFASVGPIRQGDSQEGTNQQLPIPFDFVGARAIHPYTYLRPPSPPIDYDESNVDDEKLKQKYSRKKRFIYYAFAIILFGIISGIVAFSASNRQNTNELESLVHAFPEMLKGQDEEIKTVNHTFLSTVKDIKDRVNVIGFYVQKFRNVSYDTLMDTMKEMFEVLTELKEYIRNGSSGTNKDDQLDGRCINVTMGECVNSCSNVCNGYFHSCDDCSNYVTCDNRYKYDRQCPGSLVWDDSLKRCEVTSNTCNIKGTTKIME